MKPKLKTLSIALMKTQQEEEVVSKNMHLNVKNDLKFSGVVVVFTKVQE